MRAKMAYAMEINDKGRTVPVKIGLAPVQRDSTEYEFDICLQINREHIACASKDTTFLDSWQGVVTPELGRQLSEFLGQGEEPLRCTDCGSVIMSDGKRTVKQIIEGSTKYYGRALCMKCAKRAADEAKEANNAAPTVPE